MRTITLELLRHGPAHNQLLSPLTPYLALCENHAAVTLHVPFEHNQFLYRLRALGYKLADESRVFQLQDTARVLGEILSEIPGLTAESNKEDHDTEPLTHLRLILSASELALLPFELALSPNGLPGAGQHLLLQPQMPICLTREIRRVPGEKAQWPTKPKILFISAAPQELGAQIPLEAHLLVLRRLISPWVKYYDTDEKRRERVGELLHVLPGASIEAIEDECASGSYTHIHILAHGVEVTDGYDRRFALALHNARFAEKTDAISGARLATALRPSQRPDSRGVFRPAVVTLASCDSGNVGSVAGAGASIAHALHEAGIPMVVAGQFPLSFEGSVRLLECLYEGLLWGVDPRPLLYDLRRRLYSQFQANHDWASLTAYISFPSDFNEQLQGVKIEQAMQSINAAMNHADEATRKLSDKIQTSRSIEGMSPTSDEEKKELITNAQEKIAAAKARLERLLKCIPVKEWYINALLASTEKREAEVMWWASKIPSLFDKKENKEFKSRHKKLLQKAREHYWDSFLLKKSDNWAAVQYLSLTLVIQQSSLFHSSEALSNADAISDQTNGDREEREPAAVWSLTHLLALYDLNSPEQEHRIRGLANLIELYLLALTMPNNDPKKVAGFTNLARQHADTLIALAGRDAFIVYSTRRQILRYVEWFGAIADLGQPLINLANQLAEKFPEEVEEHWK